MAQSGKIGTPRLVLEPFDERHLTERYISWLNDPRVVEFSDQRFRRHTLASGRDYWKGFDASPNFFWTIVPQHPPNGPVGTMTAYVEERDGVADVGIMIGEATEWGKGYASEAWMAVCDYLLRSEQLRKVTAGTIEPNTAMIRVMENAGMVEDGRRVRQSMWNGREVDVVHRALFRDEWLKKYPRSPFDGRSR